MPEELNTNEQIILKVLREGGCVSLETSMSPETLINKCTNEGATDARAIEQSTVALIDKDLIEYEMNEKLETSNLWLLNELNA